MKPDDWLVFVDKHISAPDSVTTEELLTLRSNHAVWKMGLKYWHDLALTTVSSNISFVTKGYRFSPEDWKLVCQGIVPKNHTMFSAEDIEKITHFSSEFHARMQAIKFAQLKQGFYFTHDGYHQKVNDQLPSDVEDMIWKQRALALIESIELHRRSHVLANKQPNGLDFALWQEINAAEYYASSRLDITLRNSSERV